MVPLVDLHKQYLSIKKEIDDAILSVISDSAFIGGKYVKEFEEKFAEFQNSSYCVGVGNGTDALEIAIEALNLEKGSEIIVPANSFISSAEVVVRLGYKIIFCDANQSNYTINLSDLEARITKNTSAIIVVHLYGHPCDMDNILKLTRSKGIKVIEDCAQAHGAEYKNKRVGCIGDIGCFSFYPGKNLGAYGDAGAIVTNNFDLATKSRMIANHGRTAKYNHEFPGRNSRLDGLQAAILTVKLGHLNYWTDHRIEIAQHYFSKLTEIIDLKLPEKNSWAKHVYHLFVVMHPERNKLSDKLASHKIQTGIHYPIALPNLNAFKKLGQQSEKGFAWTCGKDLLSLPIDGSMKVGIVDLIKKVLGDV